MGALIPNPVLGLAVLGSWTAYRLRSVSPPDVPTSDGPWHPPQWDHPQLYSITVTWPKQAAGNSPNAPTTYFFDAVLRAEHTQEVRLTEHPIQTGAAISDHAHLMPARLMLEIGISDAMDRVQASLYTSNQSKSIAAFQEFQRIEKARLPLTVTTRLATYSDLVLDQVRAIEDNRTRYALRAVLMFRQIMRASISVTTVATTQRTAPPQSARPQQTDTTAGGPKQPQPPTQSTQNAITKLRQNPGKVLAQLGIF